MGVLYIVEWVKPRVSLVHQPINPTSQRKVPNRGQVPLATTERAFTMQLLYFTVLSGKTVSRLNRLTHLLH